MTYNASTNLFKAMEFVDGFSIAGMLSKNFLTTMTMKRFCIC